MLTQQNCFYDQLLHYLCLFCADIVQEDSLKRMFYIVVLLRYI